ncbi:4-(cytidine 5'-diphospho)-2-C-methyl-D-erythritol kinase [Pseudooctadecabacter jejudonensis]|uniref:4-diphosphocytidyl-2-C-methyl-D-erythritol kinase n=1 Tax=Pseudooctadecabacter jejudonensis TaxID=1391910 RepID=A0A1Y5T0E3_9RHOB|nr:4-(cytidine 5'-diphospho)-2-C-methyl-D-erythritol kinase [Pseudooctadecabacter jejudonensis]SLN53341.1 4-diphosphocytidyl-2-C-methyl-D-erythritol kinase [Pseudooctadecabacter jejudonensis]
MTPTDGAVTEPAFAKINLTLHVTGQRADGYHLLDSMVMFTSIGDEITVRPADTLRLTIDGPFAAGLSADDDNLVLRAARSFGLNHGADITLTKRLPVASGIGGGSADAAATLRALSRLWGAPLPDLAAQVALGADVPVCMSAEVTRMAGIGDDLTHLGPAPMLDMLLVNPGVGVSTRVVFEALARKTNPPMGDAMPDPFDIDDWVVWLADQRNDLEAPARAAAPEIDQVLSRLSAQQGCQLARMSGSGATCFAIFEDADSRDNAAAALRVGHPSWWIAPTDEAPT